MIINLISDTVTKPTEEMLTAMFEAEVGDDVFKTDPTINKLQAKAAALFGMEDGLFFPSGTMANQSAIKIHTQPGDRIICDKWAHVYNYEGGGVAVNSGLTTQLIDGDRGMFTAEQLVRNLGNAEDIHQPITSLVTIENTANKGGGACWDMQEVKKIQGVCAQNKLAYHLDGARLFNALVAKNQDAKQYGVLFDSISICLSKGLGCPVGSLLLGSKAVIKKGLRIRKRMGGAMRQAGYLAAAGIYALDHHIDRLQIDHEHAKQLAKALSISPYIKHVEAVETNIVIFNVADGIDPVHFVEKLASHGILIVSMGEGKLRMVTHLDLDKPMIDRALELITHLKMD